jgi:hypothetical protein
MTRDDMRGGSELEVTVQAMLQRGYSMADIRRIHAPSGTAERLLGNSIESAVQRSVRRTGRLPCGEEVRVNHDRMERDTWLEFQFTTGTKGDSLVQGDVLHPEDGWV